MISGPCKCLVFWRASSKACRRSAAYCPHLVPVKRSLQTAPKLQAALNKRCTLCFHIVLQPLNNNHMSAIVLPLPRDHVQVVVSRLWRTLSGLVHAHGVPDAPGSPADDSYQAKLRELMAKVG